MDTTPRRLLADHGEYGRVAARLVLKDGSSDTATFAWVKGTGTVRVTLGLGRGATSHVVDADRPVTVTAFPAGHFTFVPTVSGYRGRGRARRSLSGM